MIDEGLKTIKVQRTGSAKALLDLAGLIPAGSGLPSDLSEKHNEYAWDE